MIDQLAYTPGPGVSDAGAVCLRAEVLAGLVRHAREESPRECCGALFSRDGVIHAYARVRNTASASRRFHADPIELMHVESAARARGDSLAGYYHSHPAGGLDPSRLDRQADALPAVRPFLHIIVTPQGRYRLFHTQHRRWIELPMTVAKENCHA